MAQVLKRTSLLLFKKSYCNSDELSYKNVRIAPLDLIEENICRGMNGKEMETRKAAPSHLSFHSSVVSRAHYCLFTKSVYFCISFFS